MTVELSTGQLRAALGIKEWFTEQEIALNEKDEFDRPIHRVFGYAGTGKTTIIRQVIEEMGIKDETLFAAYTGKAAMVMRKAGLPARTIHSLAYKPVPPSKSECDKISKQIKEELDETKRKSLQQDLREKSKVHFELRPRDESDLSNAKLLVLDECSMVNDEMLSDLLSFNVPLLVLGDPGQLPPIEGAGALTKAEPDAMLTEIHRQARDNPIIDFATRARHGITLAKIQLGTSRHCNMGELSNDEVLEFDQIITGKNLTRMKINNNIRYLKGFEGVFPVVGEKIICLKNNAEQGLFNGMMCEVIEVGKLLDTSIELKIKRETDTAAYPGTWVKALRAHFEAYQDKEALNNVRWWDRDGTDEFDFGYAITVHKAQGSQWDKVLLWDDGMFKGWQRQDRPKWLYTGITRAVESITIVS